MMRSYTHIYIEQSYKRSLMATRGIQSARSRIANKTRGVLVFNVDRSRRVSAFPELTIRGARRVWKLNIHAAERLTIKCGTPGNLELLK